MKSIFDLFEAVKGKRAVFTFGRMNPPTQGHELLINKLLQVASIQKATPFVFVTQTQDSKKNPLSFKDKVKYLSMGVPNAADALNRANKGGAVRTIFDAINKMSEQGFTDIIMVVGSDRVAQFQNDVGKYVGHPEKPLPIDKFTVVSAGERDPDDDGVSGLSASKMRDAAKKNDIKTFLKGMPSHLSDRFGKEMFGKIKNILEEIEKTGSDLNLSREEMPQIRLEDIDDFVAELISKGIKVITKDVSINSLLPTQKEVNQERVEQKHKEIEAGTFTPKPFIISNDNYIIDGHHQLYALKDLNLKDLKVLCYCVDLDINGLLDHAHNSSRVFYKDIQGNITNK